MTQKRKEESDKIVSRGSPRSIGIRPIRDKGRKGRRRDSGYKHVHEHQFNSSSAILCSARYPITHKALITQLISIYLITPSLPGTISTGPGRESLPPSLPLPPPAAASLSPSPISLAPRSFDCLFLSLFFRSFSQIVDTPLLFAFLQNANRSRREHTADYTTRVN